MNPAAKIAWHDPEALEVRSVYHALASSWLRAECAALGVKDLDERLKAEIIAEIARAQHARDRAHRDAARMLTDYGEATARWRVLGHAVERLRDQAEATLSRLLRGETWWRRTWRRVRRRS